MTSTTARQTLIDTGRVTDRRALRFESIDDALADVELLANAEKNGTIERIGNWTLGQALGHLAAWIGYAFDGYPLAPPPWPIRVILRLRKHVYIHNKLPAGVKIPKVPGGTAGNEPMPLERGLQQYRSALQRLRNDTPARPNPIFGPLTREEWVALQLRHAELHLSFFRAGAEPIDGASDQATAST